MSRLAPLLLIAAGPITACDPDCGDAARLDGTYEVWQNVIDADAVSGENLSAYPYDDTVFNGSSDWSIKWVPGNDAFQININDQPFTAKYVESDTSCNTFALDFTGSYTTDVGSQHTLEWTGDITWFGEEMSGLFAYSDTWSNSETLASGSISVPEGQFLATVSTGD